MAGRISGSVYIRPVRMAMIFKTSGDTLHRAVCEATTLWGGIYQLMLAPGDLDELSRTASGLGVDVMWAMDHDPASIAAAHLDGYRWYRRIDKGPLSPPAEGLNARLLGYEFRFEEPSRGEWTLPSWDADDPLGELFAVWFGCYGDDAYGSSLEQQFVAQGSRHHIKASGEVPTGAGSWVTPLEVSAGHIEYCGRSPGAGFVVVDPQDPADLLLFWNLRACGAKVFPWPIGHEARMVVAAEYWLQARIREGDFSGWRTGDGKPVGPRVPVWCNDELRGAPEALHGLTARHDATSTAWFPDFPPGWNGLHPFATKVEEKFSLALQDDGRSVDVPVPRLNMPKEAPAGVAAIQVTFDRITSPRPDWTFITPNVRAFAPYLVDHHDFDLATWLHRPAADGRIIAASLSTDTVQIAAVPTRTAFDLMVASTGWKTSQADEGVFMTRLVERLGGLQSMAANQPGVRAALVEVARTPNGKPAPAIVGRIKEHRGRWPARFADPDNVAKYPRQVFQYLLARSIIRPLLPVSCPYCTAATAWRPDDLKAQMKCELCLRDFPLGLALGMARSGRNEWLYGLAGHVDEAKLRETLSVMAALTVLGASRVREPLAFPYLLGWKVKGLQLNCEIDIVAAFHHMGFPVVVIGEVKSYRDSIDQQDLTNLRQLQKHFRTKNIECLVLIAVMRKLEDVEVELLRDFAQKAPSAISLGSSLVPVLPLVLTEPELSAVPFDENHPNRWQWIGMVELAQESCRRNLGLTAVELRSGSEGYHFELSWS